MSNQKTKIIFMGTPDFAVPSLQSLIKSNDFEIVAVFTQPDKKIGRKQITTPTPIKKIAEENNILLCQPERIRTEIETIKALAPDLIVVVAYGQIIPQAILDIPKYACINVHASLLPKYRGAACLNAPILNGDKESGITIMKMDAGLDTGPILEQTKISLDEKETLVSLHNKLSKLGAETLPSALKKLINGGLKDVTQNNDEASYVGLIKKEDGKIDWNKSAEEIERMVRAFSPWPGTYSEYDGKGVKIIEVKHEILKINNHRVGEIFQDNNELVVQCGQDSLVILKLQTEGKKVMLAKEFLNGNKDIIGKILA